MRSRIIGARAVAVASVALAVVGLAGTALAGHIASDVKSYTGCLVSGDGVIIKVKEGNAPRSACTGGQVEVHLSGGDITSATAQAGGGLTGGGMNGAVSLSLRRDCANSEVLKWNGSAWACAADTNSTYTAGTGLDLTGSEFSIEPGYRVKNTPDCSSGQFATGFDGDGDIQCAAPPMSTVTAVSAAQAGYPGPAGILDDGTFRSFASVSSTSGGAYLVMAKGIVLSELNADSGTSVDCELRSGATAIDSIGLGAPTLNDHRQTPFALMGVTSSSGATIELACAADDGADGMSLTYARLVATKIG